MATIGWCDTRNDHQGQIDHTQRPTCQNFISDADHTARLIAEAADHDRRSTCRYPNGATNQAAAYIADYRPY